MRKKQSLTVVTALLNLLSLNKNFGRFQGLPEDKDTLYQILNLQKEGRKMKKKILALVTVAAMLFSATTVFADTDLTDTSPTGDIPVTAQVSNGSVSYVVSIPDAIDFGKLMQPADTVNPHNVDRTITVMAKEITGMDSAHKLVVLMQDTENKSENKFCIKGQDSLNADKKLEYVPKNSKSGALITDSAPFANGYLIGIFNAAGEEFNVDFSLDQNQLYGVDLNTYAGSYQGTLSFFTRIASKDDYS